MAGNSSGIGKKKKKKPSDIRIDFRQLSQDIHFYMHFFTLYFMTLDTGLSFGKISSPTPLGDSKVKVIDIELILKLLFIIMLIKYGHFA